MEVHPTVQARWWQVAQGMALVVWGRWQKNSNVGRREMEGVKEGRMSRRTLRHGRLWEVARFKGLV